MLARMPVVFWTLIEAGRYAGNFLLAHKLMIRYVKGFLWETKIKDRDFVCPRDAPCIACR